MTKLEHAVLLESEATDCVFDKVLVAEVFRRFVNIAMEALLRDICSCKL